MLRQSRGIRGRAAVAAVGLIVGALSLGIAAPASAASLPVITGPVGGAGSTGIEVTVVAPALNVGTFKAVGDAPIAWSLTTVGNGALFAIDAATGVLAFKAAPAAKTYLVRVVATNAAGYAMQDVVVNYVAVPTLTGAAAVTVTAPATAVGNYVAAGGGTLAVSLSGANADKFSIAATGGALAFKAAPAPGAYAVTVTAKNAAGSAKVDVAVTVVSLPGAVTNLLALGDVGMASIAWDAPAVTGNLPLTYTVTATPGGATCTTTGNSCLIQGLSDGTAYSFAVVASNSVGAAAAVSGAATTVAAPVKFNMFVPAGTSVLTAAMKAKIAAFVDGQDAIDHASVVAFKPAGEKSAVVSKALAANVAAALKAKKVVNLTTAGGKTGTLKVQLVTITVYFG